MELSSGLILKVNKTQYIYAHNVMLLASIVSVPGNLKW